MKAFAIRVGVAIANLLKDIIIPSNLTDTEKISLRIFVTPFITELVV